MKCNDQVLAVHPLESDLTESIPCGMFSHEAIPWVQVLDGVCATGRFHKRSLRLPPPVQRKWVAIKDPSGETLSDSTSTMSVDGSSSQAQQRQERMTTVHEVFFSQVQVFIRSQRGKG